MRPEQFFHGHPQAGRIYAAVAAAVAQIGPAGVRVSRSQVAFRRKRNFAVVWMPGQYLHGRDLAPLVLTLLFPQREPSPRWKEVVQAAPGRFTHHLELRAPGEVDAQVRAWLRQAWEAA